MDDEDRADAEEAVRVQTSGEFSGLGSTEEENRKRNGLIGLFRTEGETMGVKLLKKMGWKEGQGVGPKVWRKARLGVQESNNSVGGGELHLFTPENTPMVTFVRKTDHKGLGFDGGAKLDSQPEKDNDKSEDEDREGFGTSRLAIKPKKKSKRSGIGIGILNDTGSDEEDPYEVGPRISYNKVIGGDRKKKPKAAVMGAPRPVFISKKVANAKAALGFRKCHDGRLPLDGFVLSSNPDSSSSILISDSKYLPPAIPEGWTSTRQPSHSTNKSFHSTAEIAKTSKLDPKARAAILGEAALPGKSVFDFLSTAARDRLAAASGKSNLPMALGEVPKGYNLSSEEIQKELMAQIPRLDKEIATVALGRSAGGWMPYSEDDRKRHRYRTFLEVSAGLRQGIPDRDPGSSNADWIKELQEFANCAQIFKPMTGMMANRFTSSTSMKLNDSPSAATSSDLLSKPAPKLEDPTEAAAKVGMFGHMTRSSQDFYPTRLLCKRFNVKPPAHVTWDPERAEADGGGVQAAGGKDRELDILAKDKLDDMMKEHWDGVNTKRAALGLPQAVKVKVEIPKQAIVEPDRNEALEGEKAGEAVFRAIFGDSDDDDD